MTEAWLQGPVPGVPDALMPAAHALLDAGEELAAGAHDLPVPMLWARPGGVASVGFHLTHVVGSLDRLLTYARGEALTRAQLEALARERDPGTPPRSAGILLEEVGEAIEGALDVLRRTPPDSLGEARRVGRAGLPSTVGGLLFHAAEHTRRHAGQVIATAGVLRGGGAWPDPRLEQVRRSWTSPEGRVLQIRMATGQDRADLVRMRRALWPDAEEAEVDGLLDRPGVATVVFVAGDGPGSASAFAELGLRSYAEGCSTSPVAYLEGIWVDPEARGSGLGRALVQTAARWARAMGCAELASDTGPENAASLAFHGAVGFRETDRAVCFLAGLDALVDAAGDPGAMA